MVMLLITASHLFRKRVIIYWPPNCQNDDDLLPWNWKHLSSNDYFAPVFVWGLLLINYDHLAIAAKIDTIRPAACPSQSGGTLPFFH
jgi:hypothetical protein